VLIVQGIDQLKDLYGKAAGSNLNQIARYLHTGGNPATVLPDIKCRSPYIIDGDTFSCSGARIDAAHAAGK